MIYITNTFLSHEFGNDIRKGRGNDQSSWSVWGPLNEIRFETPDFETQAVLYVPSSKSMSPGFINFLRQPWPVLAWSKEEPLFLSHD